MTHRLAGAGLQLVKRAAAFWVRQARANRCASMSELHGFRHWRAVVALGLELCQATPEADVAVVTLFGMFHDCERWDDGDDPLHGERSAQLIERAGASQLALTAQQLHLLAHACRFHTAGMVSRHPTTGVCWDSDRLTLWRVGIVPRREFLSSEVAKSGEMLQRGRAITASPPRWRDLFAEEAV